MEWSDPLPIMVESPPRHNEGRFESADCFNARWDRTVGPIRRTGLAAALVRNDRRIRLRGCHCQDRPADDNNIAISDAALRQDVGTRFIPEQSGRDRIVFFADAARPTRDGRRVSYGPGGFTPPHRHGGSVTAYITKGEIRSQLSGGPLDTFTVGQSFFEPPGAAHLVSANASNTEPAELIAVFVAEEGAELTTLLNP